MRRLLRIELFKVRNYRAFWVICGIYAFLIILVTSTLSSAVPESLAGSFFAFPEVWHHLAYVASFLNGLPGILIIMLIANEYTFKTFRQNLIDGLSRMELIYSKFILVGVIALLLVSFLFIWGLLRGTLAGHFDTIGEVFEDVPVLLRLFIQMAGYMSIAAVTTFIFRRAAFSILIFLVYIVALERLVRLRVPDVIDRYFPMKVIGGLIPNPGVFSLDIVPETAGLPPELSLLLACAYIVVCLGISLLVMEKSDL